MKINFVIVNPISECKFDEVFECELSGDNHSMIESTQDANRNKLLLILSTSLLVLNFQLLTEEVSRELLNAKDFNISNPRVQIKSILRLPYGPKCIAEIARD